MNALSKKSHHRLPETPGAGSPRQVREIPEAPKVHKMAPRSYRFERGGRPGIIEVLNENSYVMAEYNSRTGCVKWQRMVIAAQREQIEKWLEDHYRVQERA